MHVKKQGNMQAMWRSGGAKRDRTADLLHAMQALSRLSYSPNFLKQRPVRGG